MEFVPSILLLLLSATNYRSSFYSFQWTSPCTHTFVATDGISNDIFLSKFDGYVLATALRRQICSSPSFLLPHTMGNMCKWRILVEFSLMMMDFRIFDVPVTVNVLFFLLAGEIGRIGQDVNGDR